MWVKIFHGGGSGSMGIAAASEPKASVDLASLPHLPDAGSHTSPLYHSDSDLRGQT